MDRLHWRTLRDNARDNADNSDIYCTCLATLGDATQIGLFVLAKVSK